MRRKILNLNHTEIYLTIQSVIEETKHIHCVKEVYSFIKQAKSSI